MKYLKLLAIAGMFFTACKEAPKTEAVETTNSDTTTVVTPPAEVRECYSYAFGPKNLDSVNVSLNINGNTVTGSMDQLFHEKDSGRGTLTGTKDGNNISGTWTYMIEGSNQTEEIVFTINADKLTIMNGVLDDKKNDGNLTFKDKTKLKPESTLTKTACK